MAFQKLRWKIAQTAELFWWKNYLKNRKTVDYLSWKSSYWLTLLEKIGLSHINIPNHKIIDLGCGPAGIFMVLDQAKTEALDPLLDEYENILPHFKKSNYPSVTFLCQSLEAFVPTKKYDFVFCLNAINHVADLNLCFDKLVAMTQGTLIVSIDAHNYSLLKKIFRLIPGDILHPHQYDLAEYQNMLKSRGCTIEQTLLYKQEHIFNYYILVAHKA